MPDNIDQQITESVSRRRRSSPTIHNVGVLNEEKAYEDLSLATLKITRWLDACTTEKYVSIAAKSLGALFVVTIVLITYFKTFHIIHGLEKRNAITPENYRVPVALIVSNTVFCLGVLGVTLKGIYNWGRKSEKDGDEVLPENYKSFVEVCKTFLEHKHG